MTFENNGRIVAAEAEGVEQGRFDFSFLDRSADTSQQAVRVRLIVVRCGMNVPGVDGQDRADAADRAGRAECMADQ